MNNVVLVGRLTKDPELRYIPGGTAVATFSIAVNREFTNKEGKREADFINIEVWNKPAENCANYLSKGSLVGVQGALRVDRYETSTGEKRTLTKVRASRVEFLESKNRSEVRSEEFDKTFEDSDIDLEGFEALDDDDIPF
ncbi:single-strand DNA-binding protein [Alkalithermobacter thermoalcaliphilus JW-YL-7 = DSM 7308]|uniref:Single-stranded DNA-binding protein n=1 Tax=Alkalithermobacter thermoalcaliphilus JW-YL-7 = DSM 7308 TaxID=1121328 RepID=A0A150FSY6_CLOPD|nr:single-strand binding protein [[Clostridium] paradoxum JW-YL-7 = DSM 7308]SHL09278.1 single-strand DNA-binding protein [[Clostridium] paradoxum JW-YL-7 = DSM 7308]